MQRKGLPIEGNKTEMVLNLPGFYCQQIMKPNESSFTELSNRQTTTTHTYVQTDRNDPAVGRPSRDYTNFTPIQPLHQQQNAHSLSDPNIYSAQRQHTPGQIPTHSLLPNVSTTMTTSSSLSGTLHYKVAETLELTCHTVSLIHQQWPPQRQFWDTFSTEIQITNSNTAQHSELQRLQLELSKLKTKEKLETLNFVYLSHPVPQSPQLNLTQTTQFYSLLRSLWISAACHQPNRQFSSATLLSALNGNPCLTR